LSAIKLTAKLTVLDGSFYSPLFEPEAFHTGNYTEIAPQTKKPHAW
jgi:hypothetical protein